MTTRWEKKGNARFQLNGSWRIRRDSGLIPVTLPAGNGRRQSFKTDALKFLADDGWRMRMGNSRQRLFDRSVGLSVGRVGEKKGWRLEHEVRGT